MQFLYKMFVSEKEVVNALPAFYSPRTGSSIDIEKRLEKLIRSIRKMLFWKKIKHLI